MKRKGAGTLARQSRNQNIFTEENEGNKDREKLCQKCRVFGHSIAKAPRKPEGKENAAKATLESGFINYGWDEWDQRRRPGIW
jgi:hypothetical protein